jgi:hypothetical protein
VIFSTVLIPRTSVEHGVPYNGTHRWRSLPAQNLVLTRFNHLSAPVECVRCIERRTCALAGTWRLRFCPRISRRIPLQGSVLNGKPRPSLA